MARDGRLVGFVGRADLIRGLAARRDLTEGGTMAKRVSHGIEMHGRLRRGRLRLPRLVLPLLVATLWGSSGPGADVGDTSSR